MWVAVVGGGVAGALLGWRLRQASQEVSVEVFTGGRPAGADATGASGGLVRGFEPDPDACRLAAESLAELRGSPTLRQWADYREIGSVVLGQWGVFKYHHYGEDGPLTTTITRVPPAVEQSVRTVERLLPGSITVLTAAELAARYPFRELPGDITGVVERHAGYLSPERLRSAVLAELAAGGVAVRTVRVAGVTPAPAVRLADGTTLRYDAVVVAAGGWTPQLLAASGLPVSGLRTKHIQYSVHAAGPPGLPAFVDDTTGLYGRPAEDGSFLLGLPSQRWDVDPDAVEPDPALAAQASACAARRLAVPVTPHPPPRTVAAFDCYHENPGLRLRATDAPSVFTFTGGSGGAAKNALAASRMAAAALLRSPVEVAR